MLETIIVVLIVLWALGYLGGAAFPVLHVGGGNLIHVLLFIVLILVLVRLVRGGGL